MHQAFGGVQGFFAHDSTVIGLPMRFALFMPPRARPEQRVPLMVYLAGLTCTEETFSIKAGAQRVASELGVGLLAPDTSPRNTGIAGATGDWEVGEGASFYLDATVAPWSSRFLMSRYLTDELLPLVAQHFAVDSNRIGIFGHSMGGHGALTLALRFPNVFKSVSAFAPICAPTSCAWGEKAFRTYLGDDCGAWRAYDACDLLHTGKRPAHPNILVDQGLEDKFLIAGQLQPERLRAACAAANVALHLREHVGYDHGYYFVSSFIEDHLRFHADNLKGA
jgi:S-formylglutathione hydrolase